MSIFIYYCQCTAEDDFGCVAVFFICQECVLVHLLKWTWELHLHFHHSHFLHLVNNPSRYNQDVYTCLFVSVCVSECIFISVCADWRSLAVSSLLHPVYRQYMRYFISKSKHFISKSKCNSSYFNPLKIASHSMSKICLKHALAWEKDSYSFCLYIFPQEM